MYSLAIVAFLFFISTRNCSEHLKSNTTCSCKKDAKSGLIVNCEGFRRNEVLECFQKYALTETLVFSNSSLTKIPEEISLLKHIRHADFSQNYISDLDFSNLTYTCSLLRSLNVAYNNIRKLRTGSLDCFVNLRTLYIANNSMKMIEPGAFNRKLRSFQYLNAQYNDLTSIDSSVVSMVKENLTFIANVSYNNISVVTNNANLTMDDFNLNKTFLVQAMHNNIERINVTYLLQLFHVTNVLELYKLGNSGFDIRFNPLICDCHMFNLAEMLNKFQIIEPNNPVFSITCYDPQPLRGMQVIKVPKKDFNCTIEHKCPVGCQCTETTPLQIMTVVCKGSYSMTSLPREVPASKEIHIHINNALLDELDQRSYLNNVTVLDISQNKISNIHSDIITHLDMIQTVLLNDNYLKYIPRSFEKINFTRLSTLRLDGNPFQCDCHSKWFKHWLLGHKRHIPSQDKILCPSGNPVIMTNDSDFVCFSISVILSIGSAVLLLLLIIGILVRVRWTQIQVLLIANFNIHYFRKKVKTNLKYDIFLSHSSHDDDFIYQKLIPRLESHDPPFRLCRDDRDFIVGRTIAYNIISNIESSLTTLLVISNNFLRSEWCKMEFKQAHMKLLKEKTSNLIMIILEDLDPGLMDKELFYYVRTHVYLNISDKYFWAKLFQALPLRQETKGGSSLTSNLTKPSIKTARPLIAHANKNKTESPETTPLLAS